MKAAALTDKPNFNLMKQTDIQSFYHLQMPRWLFFDKKYMTLSLEAKVAYTFLLNRFQLSKLNNWINSDGEIFIIFTRLSLAAEMQISYRRVIGYMKELAAVNLIWEKRCGRGDANQIYLAKVELSDEDASVYKSTPFVTSEDEEAKTRTAEIACLENADECDNSTAQPTSADLRHAKPAHQELSKTAYQDMRFLHTSNKDIINIDMNYINSQSVFGVQGAKYIVQRNDDDLDRILEKCELWAFPDNTAKVFASAVERLFYTESYRIGNAVLPQPKVRSHLWALDGLKLQDAERKISQNSKNVKNTTAYVMAVIFNSIWESESDLMCDPYLNNMGGGG